MPKTASNDTDLESLVGEPPTEAEKPVVKSADKSVLLLRQPLIK